MMGTMKCTYETPCHWCTKFDVNCEDRCRNIYAGEKMLREKSRSMKRPEVPPTAGMVNNSK